MTTARTGPAPIENILFAECGKDGVVQLSEVTDLKEIERLKARPNLCSYTIENPVEVAFSPEGRTLSVRESRTRVIHLSAADLA